MKPIRAFLNLSAGALTGYTLAQFSWIFWQLTRIDPYLTLLIPQNKAPRGKTVEKREEHPQYTVFHVVEDGIERVSYFPRQRRFRTPLLMQHGMFHAAWCWAGWQALLAEWGWESHAISLPGHGLSPLQRPIHKCTLDYYLAFLRDAAEQLECPPVLIGHSMGGALAQWYIRYVEPPPAVVLVASWVADSVLRDGLQLLVKQDPAILPGMLASWDSSSWIRTPRRAAQKFLGPHASVGWDEFHARLGPESALVLLQHNPPFWSPPRKLLPPSLWLAGELDAVVSVGGLRRSARIFHGDFALVAGAGHNIMLEADYCQTAETIHEWLVARRIS